MLKVLRDWLHRYFSNEEAVVLAVLLVLAFTAVLTLGGNVLVPLLFSEAVNLHPVAIICAVLLFGGLWGFWGIFFAIPLATLFKAVMDAWPRGAPLQAAE
jgi:putative permease